MQPAVLIRIFAHIGLCIGIVALGHLPPAAREADDHPFAADRAYLRRTQRFKIIAGRLISGAHIIGHFALRQGAPKAQDC